jgi:hypothetical protein
MPQNYAQGVYQSGPDPYGSPSVQDPYGSTTKRRLVPAVGTSESAFSAGTSTGFKQDTNIEMKPVNTEAQLQTASNGVSHPSPWPLFHLLTKVVLLVPQLRVQIAPENNATRLEELQQSRHEIPMVQTPTLLHASNIRHHLARREEVS